MKIYPRMGCVLSQKPLDPMKSIYLKHSLPQADQSPANRITSIGMFQPYSILDKLF